MKEELDRRKIPCFRDKSIGLFCAFADSLCSPLAVNRVKIVGNDFKNSATSLPRDLA